MARMRTILKRIKAFFFPGGAFLGLSMSNMVGGIAKGEKIGKRSRLARRK
jgi:hypothetical protein